ncbi:MAG: DUF389 domain-containing protein [Bacteroidales bacterium]|nr:DUF389 domain-containing protein [Bacteroidales bacterium]
MKPLIRKTLRYLNIESEIEDFDKIHRTIEKGILFEGTNLYILVFAIVVASVGLNMNSTAVIIGAMLISPLMGPINGMGYSIATYNFPLFRKAMNNFAFAVLASLVASTAYFAISPVSTAHSELLARTSPTIYDVLIAFFGGLAGILAISSRMKGNVIPGVAIATALMPPLCTAGYGLATAQFSYFFGAIYLFTINTVFIAIASVIVSQLLRFPIRTLVDPLQKKRVNQIITAVILVTILPSIYFGYRLVQQEKFSENASKFLQTVGMVEGNFLLKSEIHSKKKNLTLIYGGNALTEKHREFIHNQAAVFDLEKASLDIHQGLSIGDNNDELSEVTRLKAEISKLNFILSEKNREQIQHDSTLQLGRQLLREIRTLYPQIARCTYTEAYTYTASENASRKLPIVLLGIEPRKSVPPNDREKVSDWLKLRLQVDTLQVYYQY